MIISINEADSFINTVSRLSDCDQFACRIISLCLSYRPGLSFVDYWTIVDDNSGICTGAICRNGTSFTLFLTDKCNIGEVSSFIMIAGASTVICSGKFKLDISDSRCKTGPILFRDTLFEPTDNKINVVVPDIKSAYKLITKCTGEDFTPPCFEDFYVDVNHRLRHNTMRMYGIVDGGNLVSVAMTIAESSNNAVIGAVACAPEYRRQGYGSSTVKYISNTLVKENKKVFLQRAENENISFYNHLGFTKVGTWREYYFER